MIISEKLIYALKIITCIGVTCITVLAVVMCVFLIYGTITGEL